MFAKPGRTSLYLGRCPFKTCRGSGLAQTSCDRVVGLDKNVAGDNLRVFNHFIARECRSARHLFAFEKRYPFLCGSSNKDALNQLKARIDVVITQTGTLEAGVVE